MGEYTMGDPLRFLPCMHTYHKDCIDDWLMRSFTCPSCMEPVDAALLTSYETNWPTWTAGPPTPTQPLAMLPTVHSPIVQVHQPIVHSPLTSPSAVHSPTVQGQAAGSPTDNQSRATTMVNYLPNERYRVSILWNNVHRLFILANSNYNVWLVTWMYYIDFVITNWTATLVEVIKI